MTRGIVLIAHNTEEIDYVNIAKYTALRAKKFLNLPVTLITDVEIDNHPFDEVIIHDTTLYQKRIDNNNNFSVWKNFDRYMVYDYTPYDHTLLLDIDFIINSDQLNKLWYLDRDFLCHSKTDSITKYDLTYDLTFGQYQIDICWATVLMFKKSDFSRAVFDMWKMIQQNYIYYAALYKFNNQLFRNDYALTLALQTVSGHLGYDEYMIQYPLLNVYGDVNLTVINDITYEFNYQKVVSNSIRPYKLQLSNTDFHYMNKFKLQELANV